MSEALTRILEYALAFSDGIERCRANTFNAADWQDAYNRLSRLRDRYLHEKPNLDPSERHSLVKVFEENTFIQGMLDIRQIGEHVQKRDPAVIRLTSNQPIPLTVKTSAGAMFEAPVVRVPTLEGKSTPLIIYAISTKPKEESGVRLSARRKAGQARACLKGPKRKTVSGAVLTGRAGRATDWFGDSAGLMGTWLFYGRPLVCTEGQVEGQVLQ